MFGATFEGTVNREPKIKEGEYGRNIEISMAVKGQGGKQIMYVSGTVWGKRIETVEKYIHKGSRIAMIAGVRRIRTFGGQEGGDARYALDVDVHDFTLPPTDRQVSQQSAANFKSNSSDDDEIPF